MNFKKMIKWPFVLSLIWGVLFFSNELFIREWRISHSEKRVQKNIVENYKNRKDKFDNLLEYLHELKINPIVEIEFVKGNKINSYLNSPFVADSMRINSTRYDLTVYDFDDEEILQPEFEFILNGRVKISYADTIIETNNWYWNFEGKSDHQQFEKFIDYLGISKNELGNLREKIKETDCEAISIYQDGSFSLRYDGLSMCQYEYYIPKEHKEKYKNYSKLDEEIFCGLNRSGLFCGYVIYNK